MIGVDDAELGGFGAGERIARGDSRRTSPVSCLLVFRTGESHGAIVAVVAERRKLSYRQRMGHRSRRVRRDRRDRRG